MTRALRNGRGKAAAATAYATEAAQLIAERDSRAQEVADYRAFLFHLDPTPENLTAWADAYGQLPEGGAA